MQKLVNKRRKGFTLVEIIIVVVIIGILAALIIPRFADATNKAKKTSAMAEHRTIVGEAYTKVAELMGSKLTAQNVVDHFNGRKLPNETKIEVAGALVKITTEIPSGLTAEEKLTDANAQTLGGSQDTDTAKVTFIKVK